MYVVLNLLVLIHRSSATDIKSRTDERLSRWLAEECLVVKVGFVVRQFDAPASSIEADVGAVNLTSYQYHANSNMLFVPFILLL